MDLQPGITQAPVQSLVLRLSLSRKAFLNADKRGSTAVAAAPKFPPFFDTEVAVAAGSTASVSHCLSLLSVVEAP